MPVQSINVLPNCVEMFQLRLTVKSHALELSEGGLHFLEIAEEELFKSLQSYDVYALLTEELRRLCLRRETVYLFEIEVLGDVLTQPKRAGGDLLVSASPCEPAGRPDVFRDLF